MIPVDLLLVFALEATSRITELAAFLVYLVWAVAMQATLALLEGVDGFLPEYDIVDNVVLRALVTGSLGFSVGLVLMILLALAAGLWCLPCVFVATCMFGVFLGIAADPDQNWSIDGFPGFGSRGGPKTPLNL